jgi:hypothetical protein
MSQKLFWSPDAPPGGAPAGPAVVPADPAPSNQPPPAPPVVEPGKPAEPSEELKALKAQLAELERYRKEAERAKMSEAERAKAEKEEADRDREELRAKLAETQTRASKQALRQRLATDGLSPLLADLPQLAGALQPLGDDGAMAPEAAAAYKAFVDANPDLPRSQPARPNGWAAPGAPSTAPKGLWAEVQAVLNGGK